MKRVPVLFAILAAISGAEPVTVNDLHFEIGDSAHYMVNVQAIHDVELGLNEDHLWDFTVPFGEEKLETMRVARVNEGYFSQEFPRAEWVVINHDIEGNEKQELYMGRIPREIVVYGYGRNVVSDPELVKITEPKFDNFLKFSMRMGNVWTSQWTASTQTLGTLYGNTYKEVVDTGQIITVKGTYPCVVLYTRMQGIYKIHDIPVETVLYHQYDWYVDSLTSFASIQSRNGEFNRVFKVAARTQRIADFWLSGDEPVVPEIANDEEVYLKAYAKPGGIKVRFNLEKSQEVLLCCYDVAGRTVYRDNRYSHKGENQVVISGVSAGVYFIKLSFSSGTQTAKCIVPG